MSILQDTYARKVDIVNRGYSGYNTRAAKLILPHLVPRVVDDDKADSAPALCTIFFGANDAALPDRTSGKQHVSLEVYVNNLRSMVTYLRKEAGVRRVVLIAPPPVSEAHRVVHAKEKYGVDLVLGSERTVEMTGKYAAACTGLAAELGVPCVDLWSRFVGVEGYGDRLLNDGLHLTAEGNGLVAEAVLEVLKGLKLDAEEMVADMPSWDAMLLEGGEGLSEAVLEDAANKVLREHLKGTGRWKWTSWQRGLGVKGKTKKRAKAQVEGRKLTGRKRAGNPGPDLREARPGAAMVGIAPPGCYIFSGAGIWTTSPSRSIQFTYLRDSGIPKHSPGRPLTR